MVEDLKEQYKGNSFVSGYNLRLEFTFEEMYNFLLNLGYNFIKHKALIDMKTYHYDGMDSTQSVVKDCLRELIAVVKDEDVLPERWDDKNGESCLFLTVFTREMKNKLLYK